MMLAKLIRRTIPMSKAEANKAIVIRWFTEFWGKDVNLAVVDETQRRTCCSSTRYTNPAAAMATSRHS